MDVSINDWMRNRLKVLDLFTEKLRWLMPDEQSTAPSSPPESAQANINEQASYYRTRFMAELENLRDPAYQNSIQNYIDESTRPVVIGSQTVRSFTPFRPHLSALQTLTSGQIAFLGVVLLIVAISLVFNSALTMVVVMGLITIYYSGNLVLTFLLSTRTLNHSAEEVIDDTVLRALPDMDWPPYTILCPLYRETEVVRQFAEAMQALDYPVEKLQILFLTEEDDNATREAIRALNLPPHFEIVTVPDGKPRTKPRACNYGLLKATGDYVVIYDAEDMPDPLQLKKAVLVFADLGPALGCVQAKLNFYNSTQNVLTRWFTAEYSTWFEMTLPGLQSAKLALPLGGTSNHFRTHVLRTLGGWDIFNVTEDCDLGLRLAQYGLSTVVLASTTYEEANPRPKNWIRQRSRWIKGYMQTYLVHMRQPLRYLHPSRWRDFFSLQLIVGGRTAVLLVNPIMWAMLTIFILFRPIVEGVYHVLFPWPVLYMAAVCLILGNALYIYTHFTGCLKREQYALVKWTLFMPAYWAMASWAAYVALFQLITKPHYWEKTFHGLHLTNTAVPLAPESVGMAQAIQRLALPITPEVSTHQVYTPASRHDSTADHSGNVF